MDLPTKRPINKGELERLKYFYLPMWSEWVRYLNAAGPSVYRSGRLVHLDLEHIEDICDEAERLMVAIVKRRNLPL